MEIESCISLFLRNQFNYKFLQRYFKLAWNSFQTCIFHLIENKKAAHDLTFLLIITAFIQRSLRESNPQLTLRSTTLRCQTQLSEVLLSQVKSRLFSVPNPVRDNPCYSLLLAVHPFLLANLWHLPPFGECSRESSKA